MYNQKRKLTKNFKYKIVDLSSDHNCAVELAHWCDHVKDTKQAVKLKTDQEWNAKAFLEYDLPEWKDIWIKKKVQMKWHRGQRAILLTYIK